jgi:hypothetical protein
MNAATKSTSSHPQPPPGGFFMRWLQCPNAFPPPHAADPACRLAAAVGGAWLIRAETNELGILIGLLFAATVLGGVCSLSCAFGY